MCLIKICCRGYEHVRQLADANMSSSLRMLILDSILSPLHQISRHAVGWGCKGLHGPLWGLWYRTAFSHFPLCECTLCTREPRLLTVYTNWFISPKISVLHEMFCQQAVICSFESNAVELLPGLRKHAVGGDIIDGQCFRWDTRETNINYKRVQPIERLLIPPDVAVSDGVHPPPSVSGFARMTKIKYRLIFFTWTQDPPWKSVTFLQSRVLRLHVPT